jgi:hypothetical protein
MPRHDRPALLAPDERTRRVAALLATGLLRLGSTLSPPAPLPLHAPQKLPESTSNELATTPDTSVTGHADLPASETRERGTHRWRSTWAKRSRR